MTIYHTQPIHVWKVQSKTHRAVNRPNIELKIFTQQRPTHHTSMISASLRAASLILIQSLQSTAERSTDTLTPY